MHDHLARVPKPPSDINPAVPEALSAIIMHLLEKEPDDRYQSANGLIHDLAAVARTGCLDDGCARVGARDFRCDCSAVAAHRPRRRGGDAERSVR